MVQATRAAMKVMWMGGGDAIWCRLSLQCSELRGAAKTSQAQVPMMAAARAAAARRSEVRAAAAIAIAITATCATNR